MDIQLELVRDKISGYLLLWETGQFRNCSRFYSRAAQVLNLFRLPRVAKFLIIEFPPDCYPYWEEVAETDVEKLALVSKFCNQTFQSATRNYLKYA